MLYRRGDAPHSPAIQPSTAITTTAHVHSRRPQHTSTVCHGIGRRATAASPRAPIADLSFTAAPWVLCAMPCADVQSLDVHLDVCMRVSQYACVRVCCV
eukprot:6198352-Pleurochrysis_carterae.AAC.1